jgi:hypothetical protein
MAKAAFTACRNRCPILTVFILLALCVYGTESDATVSVSASINTTRARVGDHFRYTISIEHGPADSVTLPPTGINLSSFRVIEYTPIDLRSDDGRRFTGGDYVITAYRPGTYVIPPIPVEYTTADGNSGELFTRPLTIDIESVGVSLTDSLRPITPPVAIPLRFSPWVRYSLIAASGLFLLAVFFMVFLRRRRGSDHEKSASPVVVDEVAEFDCIPGAELISQGEVRLLHFIVSEQLRRYVTRRYAFRAMELTHTELDEAMRVHGVPDEHAELLLDFLRRCNQVKFAGHTPPDHEAAALIDDAKDLVRRTQFDRPEQEHPTSISAEHGYEQGEGA